MAFAEHQLKQLDSKLPERHVKTRAQKGLTLSYIEGWHAIAEANRIFGFDGWDRVTLSAECIWQDGRGASKLCAYTARVRIRVRAGETVVERDGSGTGHGNGLTLGEAHESALKEAETDATKRALTTFGNLFGLALYDREQAGVRRTPKPRVEAAREEPAAAWVLHGVHGEPLSHHDTAESYCAALRRAIDHAVLPWSLQSVRYHNEPVVQQLRIARPELKTDKGEHYTDVQLRYAERAQQRLADSHIAEPQPEPNPAASIDKATLVLATPKRLRDPDHLRFVGTQPCLVCARVSAQAHHLRFAQPRAMGNKVSDEWSVPLCFTHHRALHDIGNEEAWWAEKGIDAKAEALKLWRESHGVAPEQAPSPPDDAPGETTRAEIVVE